MYFPFVNILYILSEAFNYSKNGSIGNKFNLTLFVPDVSWFRSQIISTAPSRRRNFCVGFVSELDNEPSPNMDLVHQPIKANVKKTL